MSDSNQLSMLQPTDMAMGVFSSVSMYGDYHKIAKDLASSDLIPEAFRGKPANVMIALNLSSRMRADPLAIMQSMYIVHGKPSFSASFIGAIVEQSGKFGFLEYRMSGDPGSDDYGCRIVTTVTSTGQEIQGQLITVRMAKAEDWWSRKGSKWPNMTEHMLQNRAITFFARRYAGSIMLGMPSNDELEDIKDVNPVQGQKPLSKSDLRDSLVGDAVSHETTEKKPEEKTATDEKEDNQDKKPQPKKKQQSEPKQEAPADEKPQAENTGSDSGAPFTADELVAIIEGADHIDVVNDALASTSGFSNADQKRVLNAASKRNKELAVR